MTLHEAKDGSKIIIRSQPWKVAEWLSGESDFRHKRFKDGGWWMNVAPGAEEGNWVVADEGQLRADLWNILSGQSEHQNSAVTPFHPRKADVDEIMDALRGYLFDTECEIPRNVLKEAPTLDDVVD